MIDSISQSSYRPIDLSEHLFSNTFAIICRIACGRSMFTGQHSKLKKNFHELDNFLQQVIDQRIKSDRRRPVSQQQDIIDILLGLEKDGVGPVQVTQDRIKALLMNIFVGGIVTTSITIVWAMAELIKNPRIMKKVQNEVRNYLGKQGKVEETDLDRLHYLKMVLKETLRLHAPAPMLFQEKA
ncbi:cytochrome P450 71A1-like [Papaver somniferum]|uniref:cytochrome P450 71A1-like n=1 Tax=Papaver somniferum TaxID=3469 RepID=UPI000E7043CB|nr:cytochrome P450 71A1-like [Papaver somniferum]